MIYLPDDASGSCQRAAECTKKCEKHSDSWYVARIYSIAFALPTTRTYLLITQLRQNREDVANERGHLVQR